MFKRGWIGCWYFFFFINYTNMNAKNNLNSNKINHNKKNNYLKYKIKFFIMVWCNLDYVCSPRTSTKMRISLDLKRQSKLSTLYLDYGSKGPFTIRLLKIRFVSWSQSILSIDIPLLSSISNHILGNTLQGFHSEWSLYTIWTQSKKLDTYT